MNIRKSIDYSGLYAGIDKALAANLPQMELSLELGRLVSGRPEKGAAVMAAEYITANYPDRTGFSPAASAGCGIFTGCMKVTRRRWRRL